MRMVLYIGLAICFVISLYTFFTSTPQEVWLSNLSGNLVAEIFGILLTVVIVDRIIEAKQEKERQKFKQVAFQQLRIPLVNHFQMLFNIYKASVTSKPSNNYENLRDFFNDDYFNEIAFYDFTKPNSTSTGFSGFDYLPREFKEFKQTLNKTIDKYGFYLNSDTVDTIEQLINSSLTSFISKIQSILQIDQTEGYKRNYNFFNSQATRNMVIEHTNFFIKLVEESNRFMKKDELKIKVEAGLWRNDISPQIGIGRIS